MYIASDFSDSSQELEDRRKERGSIAPWLIGGGLVAAGGLGLAMASKAGNKSAIAREIKQELVNKSANDAKKAIKNKARELDPKEKTAIKNYFNSMELDSSTNPSKKSLAERLGVPKASGYKGLSEQDRKAKIKNRQSLLKAEDSRVDQEAMAYISKDQYNNIPNKAKKVIKSKAASNLARTNAYEKGLEYSMKYTTTANFAMAGALGGGIKTGVLSRITGQLGSTVDKAKSWLQKTQQTKQQIGSATQAKNRLKPQAYVSPNASAEAIARRKYGSIGVETAPALASTIGKKTKSLTDSQNLRSSAALRTDLTAGSARQINRGSADRFSQSGTQASINDNRSLRVKYTKDPRTGKLVSAAYNKQLSLLCDL